MDETNRRDFLRKVGFLGIGAALGAVSIGSLSSSLGQGSVKKVSLKEAQESQQKALDELRKGIQNELQ